MEPRRKWTENYVLLKNSKSAIQKARRYKKLGRVFVYTFLLIFLYSFFCGGFFRNLPQPILLIPLATSVALFEKEFFAAIFALFCGAATDIACGNIPGMTSVWLMPCCFFISVLVSIIIRPNLFNYFWLNAITCFLAAVCEYFFKYILWNRPEKSIVLQRIIIPAYGLPIFLAPIIYFIIKRIYNLLSIKQDDNIISSDIVDTSDEEL